MHRLVVILLSVGLAPPALADQSMSGAEFDAYTRGKTFYYGAQGAPYGAEEYLPNHHVRWTFLDGQCQEGSWHEQDGLICFVYDTQPDPQCWSFFPAPVGLMARYENDPTATELYELRRSDEPLVCRGPKVGV